MQLGLPGFLKQQSGQAIVVVAGLLYWFNDLGVDIRVMYILGANCIVFVAMEKYRDAKVNGK